MQPIRTALCSFGMSGAVFHAPFLHHHSGFRLYGALERTKNLAQEKYPDIITYRSLDELLEDDAVELVVVNTPNDTHFEYARKALLAGKHVVVEKPFTTSIEHAVQLISLAKQQEKIISVFHNRRYDSDFLTVQKIVQEGWLGEIVEAELHFDRFRQTLSPKTHKEVPVEGSGVLYDLGSHLIDQAVVLFGKPSAVFGDTRILRPGSQVDDYFEVILYYPQLRVRLKSSYVVREPLPAFILHGTTGSFLKSRADPQELQLQEGKGPDAVTYGIEPESEQGLLHTEKDGEVIRKKIQTLPGNYLAYYNGLYEALRMYQPPPVQAEDALRVVRIIQTAHKSSKDRKVITL